MKRLLLLLCCMFSIIMLAACGGDDNSTDVPAPEATAEVTEQTISQPSRDDACPALVSEALEAVDMACQGTGRNQVCYGNIQLTSEFRQGITPPSFEVPGDIANLNDITGLQLSPMNTTSDEWGVAMMRLQADIEGTIPGQLLTFLLFGDVELTPVENEESGAMAFFFRSGIGDAPCEEAPDSGILVQTPAGDAEIALRINNVDITLGSTAYLQAQPGADMTVSVVEGQAEVTAQGQTEIARAGTQTRVELDANQQPISPPSEPQPYQGADIQAVPVKNLDRQVPIEYVLFSSEFLTDVDGWSIFEDGTEIEYNAADETSNGYVCSTDQSTGETWYFSAPDTWTGDQSAAVGGNLSFALRQSADDAQYDEADVILVGNGVTLIYDTDETPAVDAFTRFIVPFTADQWQNNETGELVNEDELRDVLSDLTELRIRGEFREGGDTGCLDYVQITSAVESIQPYSPPPREPVEEVRTDVQFAEIGFSVGDSIAQVGEVDTYNFTAAAGQTVFFDAQGENTSQISWTVTNPSGVTLFDESTIFDGIDPGLYTLEEGEYTVTIDATNDVTGAYAFQVWDVPPAQQFEIALDMPVFDGSPTTGSGHIESPGVQDIYSLSVEPGTVVYFDGTGDVYELKWMLTSASGAVIFEDESTWDPGDPGRVTLSEGDYTLTAYGQGDATGLYSFYLWSVPPTETAETAIDTTTTGTLNVPGTVREYTIAVDPNTRVYFDGQAETYELKWDLINPAGEVIFEGESIWEPGDPGTYTLTEGGDYTIRVYGDVDAIGDYAFQVWDVPEPETFQYAIGETATGLIDTVGAEDIYTFTVEAGTNVFFENQAEEFGLLWSLFDSQGLAIFEGENIWSSNTLGTYPLNRGGEYMIVVYGDGTTTGEYAFTLSIPADSESAALDTAEVVDGGIITTLDDEISTAGEEDVYTFAGQAGQVIYFDALEGSTDILWTVTDPEGTALFASSWTREGDDPGRKELNISGEYTLTVTGTNGTTGPYRLQLWQVPSTQISPVEIGTFDPNSETQQAISGSLDWPGQMVQYTFEAEPGQRVYFDAIEGSTDILWSLIDPRATGLFTRNWTREGDDPGLYTLELGGTYRLVFENNRTATGPFVFAMYDVPETQTYEAEIIAFPNDPELQGTRGEITSPGEMVRFTFEAEPGQEVYFDALEGSTDILWSLTDADGNAIFANSWTREGDDPGERRLQRGGIYTMTFDGNRAATGTFRFAIYTVPETQVFETAITAFVPDDPTPQGSFGEITNPGETIEFTFEAQPGQQVYFDALEGSTDIRWSVTDADGNDIFANSWTREGDDPGLYTLARGGTYTMTFTGSGQATGQFRFIIYEVAPIQTYEATLSEYDFFAEAQRGISGEITMPGEMVEYNFKAEAGQTIYFDALEGSTDIRWTTLVGDDNPIFSNSWTREGDDPGYYEMPVSGTYTMTFDGDGSTTGTFAFALYEVPATDPIETAIRTLNFDVPYDELIEQNRISIPGEVVEYQFEGEAGELVYFEVINGNTDIRWTTIDPDGTPLFTDNWTREGDDPGQIELPLDGLYMMSFDGQGDTTANFAFALWQSAPSLTFNISVGDTVTIDSPSEGAGVIDEPGETDIYVFEVEPDTAVYFDAMGGTATWTLTDADDNPVFINRVLDENNDPGLLTLERGGVYTITVVGDGADTGQYNFEIRTEE